VIEIREEIPDDRDAIRRLTIAAFEASEFGHNGEADLIEQLRDACDDWLSLVGYLEDDVVGHVLFSPVEIRNDDASVYGMGLAPMSVAPGRQGSGIGTLLINTGIELLAERQCPFVVVLGHPDYYPKFGFVAASEFGIRHGFAGIPQEVFFLRFLLPSMSQRCRRGLVHYQSAFGPQHDGH